jgi:serine/threonine-protein kinase
MTPTKLTPVEGYTLINKLGEGTSGEVWKVEKNGNIFALKLFKPGFETTIFAEFDTLCKIDHPNIIEEYEIGTFKGQACLVMEYLDGRPLNEINAFDFSISEIETIVKDLASALQHAHEQGLIHRDLKPANIFILPNGKVKVLDFGVATPISYNPNAKLVAGSYSYMSPEQLAGKINFQSDIWSFGVCLYEWLTGIHPYQSYHLKELAQQLLLPKIEIPHYVTETISPKLSFILLKCLHQDLEKRYKSFSQLIKDLKQNLVKQLKQEIDRLDLSPDILAKGLTRKYSSDLLGVKLFPWTAIPGATLLLAVEALHSSTGVYPAYHSLLIVIGFVLVFFGFIILLLSGLLNSIQFKIGFLLSLEVENIFKKDPLKLAMLVDKEIYLKMVRKFLERAGHRGLPQGSSELEEVFHWFWHIAKARSIQSIVKRQLTKDNQNLIAHAFLLKEALKNDDWSKANIRTHKILNINPDHTADFINNVLLEKGFENSTENIGLLPTQKRSEEKTISNEMQSDLARQIIKEGSVHLDIFWEKTISSEMPSDLVLPVITEQYVHSDNSGKEELVLYSNFFVLKRGANSFQFSYKDINAYNSNASIISVANNTAIGKNNSFFFEKWMGLGQANKIIQCQFRAPESNELWRSFLQEVIPDVPVVDQLKNDQKEASIDDDMVEWMTTPKHIRLIIYLIMILFFLVVIIFIGPKK